MPRKKTELFNGLGEADPDTIPRKLHNFLGTFKKTMIYPHRLYVARNDRLKLKNIVIYKKIQAGQEYTVIDFPHRRIDFCDFLKTTGQHRIQFLNSGLGVDSYYFNELTDWVKRIEEFYEKAGLYQ